MDDAKPHEDELVCHLADGTRLVLIGLGGIGSTVLAYLALFLHSLRMPLRLVLVDGDTYIPRDQERQMFTSLGNKAEIKAAETIAQLGPSELVIVPVPEYVTAENVGRLIRDGDYVLLCVDNHPTRKLPSDHCQSLAHS